MMRVGHKDIQRRVVLALAYLCSRNYQTYVFIDKDGIMTAAAFGVHGIKHPKISKRWRYAGWQNKAAPRLLRKQLLFPQQFKVSSTQMIPTLSDVTFSVEGQWNRGLVWLLLLRHLVPCLVVLTSYIHTGSAEISSDNAEDLLQAADQYLLEGLKRMRECTTRQDISVETVPALFDLADDCNSAGLKQACTSFILKNCDELYNMPWYSQLVKRITPEIQSYFVRVL
ncbi:hypothetical protein OROGR_031032 [Orobanche gracilis]